MQKRFQVKRFLFETTSGEAVGRFMLTDCLLPMLAPNQYIEMKSVNKLGTELFDSSYEFKLDPSFEPESDNPDKENTEKFAILQKYNRVNLVVPVDAPHMYHAAMNSTSCKLTVVGEYYWSLVKENRI